MSRFVQRREQGPRERLAATGVKANSANAIVFLENTGNPSDLLRQQNLYWKEGYDTLHEHATGVFMHLPEKEMMANQLRYRRESETRLRRPSAVGLDQEYREEGNAASIEQPISAETFLSEE